MTSIVLPPHLSLNTVLGKVEITVRTSLERQAFRSSQVSVFSDSDVHDLFDEATSSFGLAQWNAWSDDLGLEPISGITAAAIYRICFTAKARLYENHPDIKEALDRLDTIRRRALAEQPNLAGLEEAFQAA